MMKIVWRNPNASPNGIIPRKVSVVQIRSDKSESGQVQMIYHTVTASKALAVEYEVLANRKKPVHAA
jgi:hypothetical protein